ncbi:MAG: ABC transporter substrate-binding protein, partial [Chloroflexota bacterium]
MLKSKSTVMNLLTVLAVFAMLLAGCSAPADAPAGEAAPAAEEASDGGEEAADAGDGEMAPYLIGMAGYRTGAFQHTGTPVGNGAQDYTTLVNKMGGIDGWPVELHEIETGYETPRGVEAYERVKAAGNMIAFYPFSTGTTYAVTPSAFEDKIPILHAGYGISAAANGEAFPYNFLATPTYWTVEASTVQFIVDQVGEEAMADQKIAMVYVDIDYGRETLPLMEVLSEELGFELQKFPIEWPGLEQSAIWTDIARRSEPDWVILRTWGQSTVVSLQEAARVGFDMGSIIGCPWSPTDQD